ncbi:flagellar basal body rod protein FlgB [Apirhabdus apintestini]|uniref:flagellar basal body rod protein FlgB n=1 Tax=Erwinia sp. HR93 TaxID=3094840 RepID=UPI002ADED4EF|nr:flagellar basal body rod protein FlgB [Erwinia sp. HR93]MEA1062437.1 flagellar basal body rod protein FlgB [Erwinia sp. HR93]WPM84545.1 flagellar basal body rod protein FlgB [Enterobacteriaceae bacterium CA-0114]
MLDKLDQALQFQQNALRLLNQRQEILAANIANADTPGYQARDIDFSAELEKAVGNAGGPTVTPVSLSMTSAQHIPAVGMPVADSQLLYRVPDQPSADGNTVDMDRERMNFADNSVRYQSSLTIMGNQFKQLTTALSGER